MSLRRSTQTMVVSLMILLTGCKDRAITAYRAPKDAPAAAMPQAAAVDTNNLPPGHPPIGAAAQATPGADMAGAIVPTAGDASGLTWTAPAGWTAKPLGAMRKGSYAIKGSGGEADLSITAFPGATGGLEANLNRWRGQVGLPALPPTEVVAATEKIEANGLQAVVCDYAGNGTRLVGAIVPHGGNSWFFKLTGPDALVAAEKPAFLAFLQTVKAP
ncbi:MAG: hypothetical protein HYV75_02875 [Opitutae bacterium]|nr:hypothetical protein [Opitutae bacterium]